MNKNIIPLIIPVYTLILICIGIGYSISFNSKYSTTTTDDRVLGILINISTITSLIIWCYVYLPMIFSKSQQKPLQQFNVGARPAPVPFIPPQPPRPLN